MTVVVYLIGALLVVAGAVTVNQGVPIVRLEIGWTEIIGGAVVASAGFVILAIGAVLTRLKSMERALRALGMAQALRGIADDHDAEPAPFSAPAEKEVVHALAPVASEPEPPARRRAPVFAPIPREEAEPPVVHVEAVADEADAEPHVEPEPLLAEAPLHHEPLAPPVLGEEPHAFELSAGAPALAAAADVAPLVPPVEPPVIPDEAGAPDVFHAVPVEPPPRSRPNFLASFLARRSAAAQRAAPPAQEPPAEPRFALPTEPELPTAPRTPIDLSTGWDEPASPEGLREDYVHPLRGTHHPADATDEPALAEADPEHAVPDEPDAPHDPAAHEPHPAPAEIIPVEPEEEPSHGAADGLHEPDPAAPVVVGRYNAGSASYIMYSNGMIEVETDRGTHRFASMQELKAFIERRDAAGG